MCFWPLSHSLTKNNIRQGLKVFLLSLVEDGLFSFFLIYANKDNTIKCTLLRLFVYVLVYCVFLCRCCKKSVCSHHFFGSSIAFILVSIIFFFLYSFDTSSLFFSLFRQLYFFRSCCNCLFYALLAAHRNSKYRFMYLLLHWNQMTYRYHMKDFTLQEKLFLIFAFNISFSDLETYSMYLFSEFICSSFFDHLICYIILLSSITF